MANSETFCLRLNEFESNIKTTWQGFETKQEFCDVTLACDEKQIRTHKLIISASSPVLGHILKQNSRQHPLIYLRGVKYSDLRSLVSFMYHSNSKKTCKILFSNIDLTLVHEAY